MDDDLIVDRIRADADRLDDDHTDVEALVDRAVRQGRRRRTHRRIAGGLTCAVVAGAVVAVIGAFPTGLSSGPRVVPAAPVPQMSRSSAPAATRTPTPTPTRPMPLGNVTGSPADVKRTLSDLLPDSTTVTRGSSARDLGTDGFAWEHTAYLTVRDARGITYVLGGIGNGSYDDGCFNLDDCTKRSVAGGGTLWITSSPPGDKSGADRSYRFNRPQGGHVWLMERTYSSGSGPVTRDKLLLSDAAGRRLVTDPVWDTLFDS